jgi:choline monooxygenase
VDDARLEDLIAAFDPAIPMEEGWTPPSAWYTADAVYQRERAAVFGRSWQVIARAAQLVEPGAYVAACVAGEPWVAVRGADGALRAFANTCRHKATPVAGGCGRADELVCQYHGWTYGLDGRLLRAPQLGRIRGFDRAAMGLPRLQVTTWGPYVLVNADPQAPPLERGLGQLPGALARTGWDRLRYHSTHTWDVACNWKVFCDNYLDGGYHIPHRHPSLDAQLDMESYRTEVFERCSVQSSGAGAGDARSACDPAERIAGGALYAYLYPNFMINRYGPALDTNLVLPLGPDRCRVIFDFFFEEGTDPAWIQGSLDQSELTQQEDIEVSEAVQVGLGARSYDRGRYAGPERALHHFHQLLADDLRRPTDP